LSQVEFGAPTRKTFVDFYEWHSSYDTSESLRLWANVLWKVG
jgi:hypothetical protein